MKKIVCAGLCLIMSSAHASPELYYDGFMLQAALGATAAQFNLSQSLNFHTPPNTTFTRPDSLNLFANSPTGLVSLGYSYQLDNHFVIAGAFTAGYTDAKITDHVNFTFGVVTGGPGSFISVDSTLEMQLTNDFALLFKPGYIFGRSTLFYGLIGPRWGNFKSSNDTHMSTIFGGSYSADASDSRSSYELGITFGLGIQQVLTPRYSWALEYAYTTYNQIDASHSSGYLLNNAIVDTATSYSNDLHLDASSNTLLFYIAYRI